LSSEVHCQKKKSFAGAECRLVATINIKTFWLLSGRCEGRGFEYRFAINPILPIKYRFKTVLLSLPGTFLLAIYLKVHAFAGTIHATHVFTDRRRLKIFFKF
jgi:hypothetical protein